MGDFSRVSSQHDVVAHTEQNHAVLDELVKRLATDTVRLPAADRHALLTGQVTVGRPSPSMNHPLSPTGHLNPSCFTGS